jgi:hypothetical protein
MRFQLLEGWSGPGGAWIEGGTILDGHSFPGMVMPLTAKALDAEAYDAMMSWYSPLLGGNFIHEFHCAPGLQLPFRPHHPTPQSEVHSVARPQPPTSAKGRFELRSDWPVGQFIIPQGSVIDAEAPSWNGIGLPFPFPLESKALNQSGYDQMVEWYSPTSDQFLHLLHYGPGVVPKKGN